MSAANAGAPQRAVLALDGHDGSGKTTLSARLAESLGGAHVRPFAGQAGRLFLSSVERGDFAAAADVARRAVSACLTEAEAPVLVFDRHWLTAFSVLPEVYWEAWKPLPPTVLCWADLETTLSRLRARPGSDLWSFDHRHFLSVYRRLAERFGCAVVRTDELTPDESFEAIRSWASQFVPTERGRVGGKASP